MYLQMKVRGVKPNERTYTILLSGCASSPAPSASEKAEKLLAEMKRVAGNKSLGSARPILRKLEEPQETTHLIYETPPLPEIKDPSTIHYNNLLKVYSRQRKLVDMIRLYDSMCNRTKIPDHEYSPETCDTSVAPVKPDIITYTIVANNLSLLKTDEGFKQALSIWQDLRDDVEAHPDAEQMLIFDDRFLQALVNGSLYCKDKELLLKGLELIDRACGLKLDVDYPTTASYLELPSLNEREQSQVSRCIRENPRPHILDLALRSISILGLHHLASKVFFSLVKPSDPSDSSRIDPDIKHFALVLSSICDNARTIYKTYNVMPEASRPRLPRSESRSPPKPQDGKPHRRKGHADSHRQRSPQRPSRQDRT